GSMVPSPNLGQNYDRNYLQGVAAVSSKNVWAVGFYMSSNGGWRQPLIEHWNGTAWSIVPIPNPSSDSRLYGVAAVSSNDIWAVGYYWDDDHISIHTLVEHWDGTAWSIVPSPNPVSGDYSQLHGVAASGTDVWAVGF